MLIDRKIASHAWDKLYKKEYLKMNSIKLYIMNYYLLRRFILKILVN